VNIFNDFDLILFLVVLIYMMRW